MTEEQLHRRERISARRLEAFTDGVFAIAATLLVLDLSIDAFGRIDSDADLLHALNGLGNNMISFVISFLLLCLLWSVHTRQFEYVTAVDTMVIVLNSLRLLGVVLIPFTTSINSAYTQFWLGRTLLPLNFFLVIILGGIQWFYLTGAGRGLVKDLDAKTIRSTRAGTVAAMVISVLVLIVAPVLGSIGFVLYAFNPLLDRIITRVRVKRRSA